MFHALQKRLTRLYTLTTGAILAGILLVCFFYMKGAVESRNDALFSSLFLNISSRFQSESFFSDAWLGKMEAENGLIIHIEENQTPLFFRGSWKPETSREHLIAKGKKEAEKLGVSLDSPSVSQAEQTPVFTIQGENGDSYCGMFLLDSTSKGNKALLVLQDITASKKQFFFQGFFFFFAGIAGIFLLYLASWYAVGKTLVPLKENQKKQAEFIAAASHELRSPLAVIQASASAIRTSPKSAELMVSNIEKECSRMGALLKDLLLLAAADSRKWNLTLERHDADTLLLDTYEIFEPLCRQRRIQLHLEIPEEELPALLCDKNRVAQILTVLLDNALSYTTDGGQIELAVFQRGRFVFYSVADHGKGIPDSEKERIFDRFYQSDRARNQKEHFGLGLSIAKELARLHRGDLFIRDTQGGGSTFLLKLPFVQVKNPAASYGASNL